MYDPIWAGTPDEDGTAVLLVATDEVAVEGFDGGCIYMFIQLDPPQYSLEFAAQVMVHVPLVDAREPELIVLPQ
jgi:hypothetical protein